MTKRTLKQAEEIILELEEIIANGEINFESLRKQMNEVRENKDFQEKILKNNDRDHRDCLTQNMILATLVAALVINLM
jgi:hypothetical protein